MAAGKGPPPKPAPKVDLDALLKQWKADKKSRVFLQIAEEYRKQDALDAALSVLKEGLKNHPGFAPAHVAMARCLLGKGQLQAAQAELEPIVKKAPDNLLAGKLYAEVLQERGERQQALEVLKRLAPFAPDDEEVADRLALLQAAMGGRGPAPSSSVDTAEFSTSDFTGDSRAPSPSSAPFVPPPMTLPPPVTAPAAPQPAPPPPRSPEPLAAEPEPLEAEPLEAEPLEAEWVEEPEEAEPAAPVGALPPVPVPATTPDDLLGAPLAEAPPEEDDFASVTLAELYEAQGGRAEAAAIYERLLQKKPGDPALLRALERCRAPQAPPGSVVASAAAPPPPPPPRPRWEPVRARESAPPEPVAGATASPPLAAEPPRPAPAPPRSPFMKAPPSPPPAPSAPAAAPVQPPRRPGAGLRAQQRELERWLAAVERVRAAR